jgi:hypothetical protein
MPLFTVGVLALSSCATPKADASSCGSSCASKCGDKKCCSKGGKECCDKLQHVRTITDPAEIQAMLASGKLQRVKTMSGTTTAP